MRAADHTYTAVPFAAMAHRGGSLYPPNEGKENTMAAFANAVELGYTYIETDVQVTSDGELVCMHDPTLERVAGMPGSVGDYTAEQLRHVEIDHSEPVAFFADVVQAFPSVKFNVDMKVDGAVEPLARAVDEWDLRDRILVDSFSQRRLSCFRTATAGRIPTAMGPMGVAMMTQVPFLGSLIASPGVAVQAPISERVGPLKLNVITPASVARAHAAGKVVHVWTIDDPDDMNRLIDMGVDGLITDRPDILKNLLIERDMWT